MATRNTKSTNRASIKTKATVYTNGHAAGAVAAAGGAGPVSAEQIRLRAYELFLARGGAHGDDLADWLRAERELSR